MTKEAKRSFLYFVPGAAGLELQRSQLPPMLADRLRDTGWLSCRVESGPGGMPGIAIDPAGNDARYLPKVQQWHKVDSGGCYIGWHPDRLPGPKDLLRAKPLDGQLVELGDGNRWLVPILHGPRMTLPEVFGWGPNGEIELCSIPQYDGLCALSARYRDTFANEGKLYGNLNDWMRYISSVLAVNYRVGREEVAALRLITTEARQIVALLDTTLGFSAVDEEKKTTQPDS